MVTTKTTLTHAERNAARERVADGGMCCNEGLEVACVCRRSVRCPTHGQLHVGSHD